MIDFENIKAIGFDLDNTLYKNNPEIDKRIINEIKKKILEIKPKLKTSKNVLEIFENLYLREGSKTNALKKMGYPNAEKIMYGCLLRADFTDLLERDEALLSLMKKIKNKYFTFLITAMPCNLAIPRLEKLGLNLSYFSCAIFGDTPNAGEKIDGSIYKFFLSASPYPPKEHIYIGDSLRADILPAKFAGMRTIAVGNKIPEADFSIPRIYDLENLLL